MIEPGKLNGYLVAIKEAFEAMSDELEELRKHEVEWDMAKARIKELERQLKKEG